VLDRSVLFSGDLLFPGRDPVPADGIGGRGDRRPRGAEAAAGRDDRPGHGGVAGPELIDEVLGYLRFVLSAARAARSAGLSPLEAARELDLGPYGDLIDAERIVGNLHCAYAELDGAPPGAPIDTFAALTDMVSYTSGQPLTCYA
jgi:cyclase